MSRILYVTTANTGGSLDVPTPEGVLQARRIDPHGVLVMAGEETFSVPKSELPMIARFFAAAAVRLGVDINDSWDAPEGGLIKP